MNTQLSTEIIRVEKLNDVHMQVIASPGLIEEIRDFFTFMVPDAKFSPAYKAKHWDGKISLCSFFGVMYRGLLLHLKLFAKERGYQIQVGESFNNETLKRPSSEELDVFINHLNLPFKVRDYQRAALDYSIWQRRLLLISPTASGKSLIIHMIARWYLDVEVVPGRVLLIVPTINLVKQMEADLIEYGTDRKSIQTISEGASKVINENADIVITTWQSIVSLPKSWYLNFTVVIGDEAHTFKAKSLKSIMERMEQIPVRIGTTGTLDGSKVHKLVLEGLFGPVYQVEKTASLMEAGQVASLKVRSIVLKYTAEETKAVAKMSYQEEMDWIISNPRRLKFIVDLVSSLEGNTIVLFNFVDKHGIPLYKLLLEADLGRPVYLVHGGIDGDEREEIRQLLKQNTNAIVVASFGCFSTGINIPNLSNGILASPTKSTIRLLQSVGRILRLTEGKTSATWFDIADDLQYKSHQNHTLKHFIERAHIYESEGFEHKLFTREI